MAFRSIGEIVASLVDGRSLLKEYSAIPATVSLPCDAAQLVAACDLRAARAHLKGSHHV